VNRSWVRDVAKTGLALFAVIAVSGFIAIGLGWRVAARNGIVALQIPALISGGLGGLALILTGAGLLHVQTERRLAARERESTSRILNELQTLVGRLGREQP
jgi:membrane-bound ClpP family serine protease